MTPRQYDILSAIVRQYADLAEPIGSLGLARDFELSPATIRAEMAILERLGYIYQPHTSAGRVPTDKGYRYFVNSLEPTHLAPRTVQTIEKRVSSLKNQTDQAIRIATETLSDLTGNTAFATLSGGLYFYGLNQLFSQPELVDPVRSSVAARFLDAMQQWLLTSPFEGPIQVYIGRENPIVETSGLTTVIACFESPYSRSSYIGIVGPTRQSYSKVINLVENVGQQLEEVLN